MYDRCCMTIVTLPHIHIDLLPTVVSGVGGEHSEQDSMTDGSHSDDGQLIQ